MKKFEVFIMIGRMEIRCENNKKVLNELSNLQDALEQDNLALSARILGRIFEEIGHDSNINDELNAILTYVSDMPERSFNEEELKSLPIEDLNISMRSFKVLRDAGINSVYDILVVYNTPSFCFDNKLMELKGFGKQSYKEVVEKLESLGIL